ncbi:MAG: NfeD family protein [Alistipes sp.]
MFFIILLILFGLLFLVAEIVLLPGVSIGAILSLVCYGSAVYIAFVDYGMTASVIVVAVVLVLSILATILSLRAKTWQRFSLTQKINSSSMTIPEQENVKIGDTGITVSRLSPMGKVEIGGKIYEAKSGGDYVDPKTNIEVVGFENFNVIVKITK